MGQRVDEIKDDIYDFIDRLAAVFRPGGPEITVFVHNTKIDNADLLITSGDWDRVLPPLRAFLEANGIEA